MAYIVTCSFWISQSGFEREIELLIRGKKKAAGCGIKKGCNEKKVPSLLDSSDQWRRHESKWNRYIMLTLDFEIAFRLDCGARMNETIDATCFKRRYYKKDHRWLNVLYFALN